MRARQPMSSDSGVEIDERNGASQVHLAELLAESKEDLEAEIGLRIYGYRWQAEIEQNGEMHIKQGASLSCEDPLTVAQRLEGTVTAMEPLVGLSSAMARAERNEGRPKSSPNVMGTPPSQNSG